jgi:excisionase family DNA binding protein
MPRLKPQPTLQPQARAAAAAICSIKKVLLSIEEVAAALSLGRTTVFALIRCGKLRSVKCGKRRLVAADELPTFAASLHAGEVL